MGDVGVRATVRESGSWEEGGGVMEEVVRGVGETNFLCSGEAEFFDRLTGIGGVSGRAVSVVGTKSCDARFEAVWESILPKAHWPKRCATRQEMRRKCDEQRIDALVRAMSAARAECVGTGWGGFGAGNAGRAMRAAAGWTRK